MIKQEFIDITNTVYRLTLLFPKKEPLRYKIREIADDILANSSNSRSRVSFDLISEELEILDSFLEVAKKQNWVKEEELLKVQKKYANLKELLSEKLPAKFAKKELIGPEENKEISESRSIAPQIIYATAESLPVKIKKANATMPERQQKILAFLRENGRAQVWQIKQILPEVTKRTLRRDFDSLLKQGHIERIGERNGTFYQIKSS